MVVEEFSGRSVRNAVNLQDHKDLNDTMFENFFALSPETILSSLSMISGIWFVSISHHYCKINNV
ncbi:MAG: hypothetical protein M1113_05400 [Candidatus Thermoplasmatota archaeon]|nr:hypothetical protein [Candidatus Thermoplasmatota archaeon]